MQTAGASFVHPHNPLFKADRQSDKASVLACGPPATTLFAMPITQPTLYPAQNVFEGVNTRSLKGGCEGL